MSQVHKDLPDLGFPMPEGITKVAICTKSGLLPIEGVCDCDPRGSCVREEYFEIGTVPTEYCDHHIGLKICTLSGCVASANCPEYMCIQKVFIIGGDPMSADGPYLAPDGFEDEVCPIHRDGNITDNPDDPTP